MSESEQNLYGATLRIGFRDGDQTVTPSDYTKYRRLFLTGVSVEGRVLNVPTVGGLKNYVGDRNNAFPVTVQRGTATVVVNPAEIKTLETDGTANGLSDETGSPALAGFSEDAPLAPVAGGNPGSSVYPARSDHQHPPGETASPIKTVANSPFQMVAGAAYFVNTTDGPVVGVLPLTVAAGVTIGVADIFTSWATHAFTIERNGQTIMGLAEDMSCHTDNDSFELDYNGIDWRL